MKRYLALFFVCAFAHAQISPGVPGGSVALTGDITTSGNTATLATVNGSPGACGDSTHSCTITVDAKGRVTSASPNALSTAGAGYTAVETSLTSLTTDLAGACVTNSGCHLIIPSNVTITLTSTINITASNVHLSCAIGGGFTAPVSSTFNAMSVQADNFSMDWCKTNWGNSNQSAYVLGANSHTLTTTRFTYNTIFGSTSTSTNAINFSGSSTSNKAIKELILTNNWIINASIFIHGGWGSKIISVGNDITPFAQLSNNTLFAVHADDMATLANCPSSSCSYVGITMLGNHFHNRGQFAVEFQGNTSGAPYTDQIQNVNFVANDGEALTSASAGGYSFDTVFGFTATGNTYDQRGLNTDANQCIEIVMSFDGVVSGNQCYGGDISLNKASRNVITNNAVHLNGAGTGSSAPGIYLGETPYANTTTSNSGTATTSMPVASCKGISNGNYVFGAGLPAGITVASGATGADIACTLTLSASATFSTALPVSFDKLQYPQNDKNIISHNKISCDNCVSGTKLFWLQNNANAGVTVNSNVIEHNDFLVGNNGGTVAGTECFHFENNGQINGGVDGNEVNDNYFYGCATGIQRNGSVNLTNTSVRRNKFDATVSNPISSSGSGNSWHFEFFIPPVFDVTGRTTTISSTTLVNIPGVPQIYKLHYNFGISTQDTTASTLTVAISWTENGTARTYTLPVLNLNQSPTVAGAVVAGDLPIMCDGATNVNYSATVGGTRTSGAFALHLKLE